MHRGKSESETKSETETETESEDLVRLDSMHAYRGFFPANVCTSSIMILLVIPLLVVRKPSNDPPRLFWARAQRKIGAKKRKKNE